MKTKYKKITWECLEHINIEHDIDYDERNNLRMSIYQNIKKLTSVLKSLKCLEWKEVRTERIKKFLNELDYTQNKTNLKFKYSWTLI